MTKHIKSYFYAGLFSLLPLVLTLYIFNWVMSLVMIVLNDSFVTKIIKEIILKLVGEEDYLFYFQILTYALSLVTMIVFICFVGLTLKIVFFAKIAKRAKTFLGKIPFINQIYTTISQITSIIASDRSKTYQKVVAVEYPRKGIYSIGFLTSEKNPIIEEITGVEKIYNIFIPTSPNPTSGMFIAIDAKDVKILDIKVDDAVKLIISGGVILPDKHLEEKIEENIEEEKEQEQGTIE
ncbi:DUF502 domain-containing protein [Fusobacterium ulcerans]|uniref:DUF502 domain-containing protein n=1 Tax=Fusobacterium ulcerans TaxID=861 RepID=UPI001D0B7563|nr:DUF502 domain-containing protein [Fusobacterium ulcerans]MCB8566247.1 DUF502 domain-containing protein [Fusobacterium ulcerans]MCB8650199.1 DUF502 domain-containing protein [Fusobacterium ulcerans]